MGVLVGNPCPIKDLLRRGDPPMNNGLRLMTGEIMSSGAFSTSQGDFCPQYGDRSQPWAGGLVAQVRSNIICKTPRLETVRELPLGPQLDGCGD